VRLAAGQRGDPLHEIEDRFGRTAFLGEHRLDDLAGFGFREAAMAKEVAAFVIGAGDNAFARGLDTIDERLRGRIGEVQQGGCRFVGEPVGGVFAVADRDFLEIFDAPQIPVLADRR
jgi:hypothetical protein